MIGGWDKACSFKLFQTGRFFDGKPSLWFTKALPRTHVFCGVHGAMSKNQPDCSQIDASEKKNFLGQIGPLNGVTA